VARDLTVSVDAMGGDAGPAIVAAALVRAAERHPNVKFVVHGNEAVIAPIFKAQPKLAQRVTLRHSPNRVRMEDKPSHVLRRGRDTSMWAAIDSVKSGEAEAAISAGNTGALMALSMFNLGILDGISRPAIASVWPTMRGQSVVLDVGANVAATAEQLVEFAIMGAAYARVIFGLDRPSVGLLNVGEEDTKGIDSVKLAGQMLRDVPSLSFEYAGFVEGDDITGGFSDVVVTDGFTGNIALKTAEGTAKLIVSYMRSAFKSSLMGKLGAAIASGALKALKRKLDPRAAGGGVFLGLNGVVVKAHGGTDEIGFASALDTAIDMAEAAINARIAADRAHIVLQPEAVAS
jgi:glycerol-3-phosphate acyltransferase PlsX